MKTSSKFYLLVAIVLIIIGVIAHQENRSSCPTYQKLVPYVGDTLYLGKHKRAGTYTPISLKRLVCDTNIIVTDYKLSGGSQGRAYISKYGSLVLYYKPKIEEGVYFLPRNNWIRLDTNRYSINKQKQTYQRKKTGQTKQ